MKLLKLIRSNLRLILFSLFLLLLQLAMSYIFIREYSLKQINDQLHVLSSRIASDLLYENGKFDTTRYTSDPLTPHPNGSSGYIAPLYILTLNGFVIERNNPINGFLDSSDFQKYLSYTKPQTINTETNENWRVESKTIARANHPSGIIVVSYYNPQPTSLEEIDAKLQKSIDTIYSELSIKSDSIDASHVDIRSVDYDISFEVINSFNKVLINNGRTPSFIDVSYVAQTLANTGKMIIVNQRTQEQYLVHIMPLVANNSQIGVVIAGQSIHPLNQLLIYYLLFAVWVSIFFVLPLSLFTSYILRRDIARILLPTQIGKDPKRILFNKKDSTLIIDSDTVDIPYASNQYYLCEALFAHPKKRWEQDELLERFGGDIINTNNRIVYDAALAINRKVQFKLIDYKDKTFRINPQYTSHVIHL